MCEVISSCREALEAQAAMVFVEVSTPAERADLRKLAAWVDTLSQQPNRALFVLQHQKFHYRIAECTRSAALCDAIEKTHALASIWFSVTQPSPDPQYHRLHQDLVDELLTGDQQRAPGRDPRRTSGGACARRSPTSSRTSRCGTPTGARSSAATSAASSTRSARIRDQLPGPRSHCRLNFDTCRREPREAAVALLDMWEPSLQSGRPAAAYNQLQ